MRLKSGRPSPLWRWSLLGCTRSFDWWSHDPAQHHQHNAGTCRSCPAVHWRGAWSCSGPCGAATCLQSVLWARTVDSLCRSSAVAWTCLYRDIHENWAYTAGRRRGCRWWRTWPGWRRWRTHREEPKWRLQKQPTSPRLHRGSRRRGSRYIRLLTAVGRRNPK